MYKYLCILKTLNNQVKCILSKEKKLFNTLIFYVLLNLKAKLC